MRESRGERAREMLDNDTISSCILGLRVVDVRDTSVDVFHIYLVDKIKSLKL